MSKPKVVKASINLLVEAGKAAAAPPVGPAIGQLGVGIMDFCKPFNEKTQIYRPGTILPVKFTAYTDRTFEYEIRTPTVAFLLKKAAGVVRGSARSHHETVAKLDIRYAYEIMKIKKTEERFYNVSEQAMVSSIINVAKEMGITFYKDPVGERFVPVFDESKPAGDAKVEAASPAKKKGKK